MAKLGETKADLIGMVFGDLTVKAWDFMPNQKIPHRAWLCNCTCGEECYRSTTRLLSGSSTSCGHDLFEKKSKAKLQDLTGQRFGRLTVIEKLPGEYRTPQGIPQVKYLCLCDCGNYTEVYGGNLRKGNTRSCGCLSEESRSERSLIDLTGLKFGLLTVLERAEDYISPAGNHSAQWLCICECGELVIVNGNSLRRGLTKSCGCIKNSLGEHLVKQYLRKNHIKYRTEYKFKDLLTENGNPMRFDFGILNDDKTLKFLIEYQGPQHYKEFAGYNGKSFGEYQRTVSDPAKKEYCKRNNIFLFEIRYDEDVNEALDKIFCKQAV